MLRRRGLQIVNRLGGVLSKLTYCDSSVVQVKEKVKDLVKESCVRKKRKFKKYLIENLFINKFEETLLEYPEIESLKAVKELNKQCKLAQKYLTQPTVSGELILLDSADKVMSAVKNYELTGFKLPIGKSGFGYLNSEYTYMLETLSWNPSLARTISENEDFGAELISSFGSSSQKEEYLLRLCQGEITACFAHSEAEPLVSLDPISLNTTAEMTSDGQQYVVNGRKSWVLNATQADIIIFSANVTSKNLEGRTETSPTLFVVDKNLDGIKIHKPIEQTGLSGVDICEVTFDNVMIPFVSVLGEINKGSDIVKKILVKNKLSQSAQSIGIMKKLGNAAISQCIHTKYIKSQKYERQFFKSKIGEVVARIYAMESMTYLVSGRLDSFDEADLFLESLILKIQSSETLQFVLRQTLSLLGTSGFSNYDEVDQIIKESQYYMCSDDRNDHLRLILASAGCRHALKHNKETNFISKVFKNLNKQNIPYSVGYKYPKYINPKGVLLGYLHLMFQEESKILEDCVFTLKKMTDFLLDEFGENIFERHIELILLADLLLDIYAMSAILGRASRAFCICLKNFEVDRLMAWRETHRIHFQFQQKAQLLQEQTKSAYLRNFNKEMLNYKHDTRHDSIKSFLVQNKRQSKFCTRN